jgi:hypothetical protein
MENFTKSPWKINKITLQSSPEEKEGHIILIRESADFEGVTITCDTDHTHRYPQGTYHAGPPETINGLNGSYTITLHPGEPNEIVYEKNAGNAGSWTADDSSSSGGDE